ncbi:MAG: MarR family transcriptional regulator [Bacteroidota bacterium]
MSKLQKDLKKSKPFELQHQEVIISILRTNELFQYRFGQLFRKFGLSQPQYNILRILRGAGEQLPSLEIASRMINVVPSITNLIDKLERKGLVQRERSEKDRRVWFVGLTAEGLALTNEMDESNLNMHIELVGHLSEQERTQLLELLEKARQSVNLGE